MLPEPRQSSRFAAAGLNPKIEFFDREAANARITESSAIDQREQLGKVGPAPGNGRNSGMKVRNAPEDRDADPAKLASVTAARSHP